MVFSVQSVGGRRAFKITHQEAVAAIASLELLSGDTRLIGVPAGHDWEIRLEGADDVSITFDDGTLFMLQVKDSRLSSTDVQRLLTGMASRAQGSAHTHVALVALQGVDGDLAANYRAYFEQIRSPRVDKAAALRSFAQAAPWFTDRMSIDLRPLTNDDVGDAVFSSALRRLNDFSLLSESGCAYVRMTFAESLRGLGLRSGAIDSAGVRRLLQEALGILAPLTALPFRKLAAEEGGGYVPMISKNGSYRPSDADLADLLAIKKQAEARWRRLRWRESLKSALIGGKTCPSCRHPLVSGFAGLWGGVHCAECGWFESATLVVACTACRRPIVVAEQPEIDPIFVAETLTAFVASTPCPHCHVPVRSDLAIKRCVVVPLPGSAFQQDGHDSAVADIG